MNDLLIYLLKVIAIQGVLYIIYALVFHKSGRHAFNRGFIILAIAVSFIIPLLSLPGLNTAEEIVETETPIWQEIAEFTSAKNVELIPVANVNQSASMSLFIITGIMLVSLFLVLKMIFSHFQLIRLMKHSDSVIKNGHPIYISKTENPFSYFKAIFMPEYVINSSSFDTILYHELVHVRKWHSMDRILIEVATSILWFNPFHYLYRNRLIETHEFQADEEVISLEKNSVAYQEILYEQSHTQYAMATANYFKLNTIKTRIKMINKTTKKSKWHYLLILPVFVLLAFSFAKKDNSTSIDFGKEVENVLDKVSGPTDSYTPSIMPVKNTNLVRLTSSFGERVHPILKKKKMHEGLDFSIPVGNDVMATANGTVVKVAKLKTGYGNLIKIDHNRQYLTVYAQLSGILIEEGQVVKRGEVIALSGNSGSSTGPHLHYEVRKINGKALDPIYFIQNYDFKSNTKVSESFNLKLSAPNQKLKVVIDAGHGGKDAGTSVSGIVEKEIAIKVAQTVAENFRDSKEVGIILTRGADEFISLTDRALKSKNANLFISIHVDATPNNETPSNFMSAIYYDGNEHSENSKKLAALMGREFSTLNSNFKAGMTAGFIVLKNADCPAVSLSIGNISNTASRNYMNSEKGIQEIAQKLSDIIVLTR